MMCLKLLFLIIMMYAAICDWKDRIVYTKTWIGASIISLAIALIKKYTTSQIIAYSIWLCLLLIIMDILCTIVYKIHDKKFILNRNLDAIKAVDLAESLRTQESIDMARGFVFNSSGKRTILSSKLDKLQRDLNKSLPVEELINKCSEKVTFAEISNTGADLYTARAFFICIGNVTKENKISEKKLNKRLKELPDKIVDEVSYGIGWGDIKIAPSITLFYGSKGAVITLIVLALSLIGQKFIKQNDETVPLVTYLAFGCLIAFFI